MIYIPIGLNCQTALLLKKHGLRKYSLPFDWISTNTNFGYLNKVFNVIEKNESINSFVDNYFNESNFKNGKSLIDKDEHPHISAGNHKNPDKDDLLVIKRRINRFKEFLLNEKKITLVLYHPHLSKEPKELIKNINIIFQKIKQFRDKLNLETFLLTICFLDKKINSFHKFLLSEDDDNDENPFKK